MGNGDWDCRGLGSPLDSSEGDPAVVLCDRGTSEERTTYRRRRRYYGYVVLGWGDRGNLGSSVWDVRKTLRGFSTVRT